MIAQFRIGFVALLCSLFLFQAPDVMARDHNLGEDILYYTNKFRASKGRKPLVLDEVISDEAARHSRNMARKKAPFGHQGFNERTQRIRKALGSGTAFAENVASGHLDAEAVVDLWIKSPGHRKNLLGDYRYMGIGIAEARDGSLYFTQIFFSK